MAMQTLEHERGDDRHRDVEIERLHEMTGHTFKETGYISDTPEAGIGDVVLYPTRQPNSPHAIGGMALRRTFLRPGQIPSIRHLDGQSAEGRRGRDASIMPNTSSVPPSNYLG